MLKLVWRERYPGISDLARRYNVATGRVVPAPINLDVVVDLQHLGRSR